ncbi:hypothetical protein G6F62_012756 [Rhizopus arrhizus]|nr:hypothetical protein G6F62_012756 [Rhizopus arrhizus]
MTRWRRCAGNWHAVHSWCTRRSCRCGSARCHRSGSACSIRPAGCGSDDPHAQAPREPWPSAIHRAVRAAFVIQHMRVQHHLVAAGPLGGIQAGIGVRQQLIGTGQGRWMQVAHADADTDRPFRQRQGLHRLAQHHQLGLIAADVLAQLGQCLAGLVARLVQALRQLALVLDLLFQARQRAADLVDRGLRAAAAWSLPATGLRAASTGGRRAHGIPGPSTRRP